MFESLTIGMLFASKIVSTRRTVDIRKLQVWLTCQADCQHHVDRDEHVLVLDAVTRAPRCGDKLGAADLYPQGLATDPVGFRSPPHRAGPIELQEVEKDQD